MRRILSKFSKTIVFLLKAALFVSLFACFFLLLAIDSPQILRLSRTAGVTMVTFAILGISLMSIYGGYAIGKQKSKPIIYSMVLATWITDIITYLQLMIMNSSPTRPFDFWGVETLLLLAAMVVQAVVIIIFTYLGNAIYFRINPPERCCIVTSSQDSLNHVIPKIKKYKLQYQIQEIIDYQDPGVYDAIRRSDTIFLYDIPVNDRTYLMEFCYEQNKNIYYNLEICDVVGSNAKHVILDDMSFLAAMQQDLSLEQKVVKRAIDLFLSIIAFIIFSPIMLICAVAIKLCDHGPVFFRQARATKNGKTFRVYKFRTMKAAKEGEEVRQVSASEHDDRITPVGKVLHKFRLDELPQVINIIKGEMSIVGPRPEMLENVSMYTEELPEFSYRLKVKAGLTGFAQVYGKYNTSPKDKLILDMMYIEKYSIWQDVKLILQTLIVFFKADSTEGFSEQKQMEFIRYRGKDSGK